MSVSIHILKFMFPPGKGEETQFTFDVLLVKLVVHTKNIKPELASWLLVYYTPFLLYVQLATGTGMTSVLHKGDTLDLQ